MATTDSSAPHAHDPRPEVAAGDPFIAAGRHSGQDQDRPHGCLGGYVYLGELVVDEETGEEVEVYTAVRCRRCVAPLGDHHGGRARDRYHGPLPRPANEEEEHDGTEDRGDSLRASAQGVHGGA
jgi:hypothetical protein